MVASMPVVEEKNARYSRVLRDIEASSLEAASPQELLTWGIENFHPKIALSSSFGAPEGMVLLDMMHRIDAESRVFVLDTGRLHQATYDLIDRVRDRYDKEVEVVCPEPAAVEQMTREHGMNLFYESMEKRRLCCQLRKVAPMRRKLEELDAYVTGLRRDQTENRSDARKLAIDHGYRGIVKLNPLVDWTIDDVWKYVRQHNVPVNRLQAEGYPSVGCAPCTRAVAAGQDPRAGRWWWENDDSKECGLHVADQSEGSGI